MTEQELLKKIGTLTTPEHLLECAKAYADARVAQECKVLDETVTLLHQTIANRNVEIAELKAESKYWNERWEAGNKFQDAAFNSEIENYHEVKRLNAEIKRLRDGVQKVADHLWVREPRNMSWLELRDQVSILHGFLPPRSSLSGKTTKKKINLFSHLAKGSKLRIKDLKDARISGIGWQEQLLKSTKTKIKNELHNNSNGRSSGHFRRLLQRGG